MSQQDNLLNRLLDKAADVVSDKDGELEASDDQRKISVFFKNGILAVEKNSKWNVKVVFLKEIIKRKGYNILSEVYITFEDIRTIYEEAEKLKKHTHGKTSDSVPMQKTVIKLLAHAATLHASDIHINVGEYEAQVRMRIDGDIVNMYQMPAKTTHELLAAAYNMADAGDATYRIYDYQAARISDRKSPLPPGLQGVRLQFNPLGSGGRYLIARLLYADKRGKVVNVGDLGFHKIHVQNFDRMRERPEGVNFISGPTGSGKSTTLKVALEAVYRERQQKINILTIEDPPEYTIEGASQLPVTNVDSEEERGLAYNKAIIAALRSDPDVIMPGEARDRTVINLVFTAAMTGHQVWTSLHANSALAIFDRVKDQGVEPYKLYDPDLMTGLLAQRLLRQLCYHCKIPAKKALESKKEEFLTKRSTIIGIAKTSKEFLHKIYFVNRNGCQKCSGGYKGRSVVAEIIIPDHNFMDFMRRDDKLSAVHYWEEEMEGMSMKEHAWLKLISGQVDPRDMEDKVGPISLIKKERIPTLIRIEEKYNSEKS